MAKPVERGQRASAGPSHSDQRPQFSQPPRPGTPFSGPRPGSPFWAPQWDDDILSQWKNRPGTSFSVPQGIDDSAPQWDTYLTSTKFPRDFAPPGVLRLARHKFRCQKPYEDKTFKVPNTGTADRLRSLRALIKTTSSKKTLDPLKELKEIKEGQVPLPPEVPECRSNPLSREPRPSALPPDTRKRVASTSVHRPGKVQRSLDMSTVFEEPMDFEYLGTRVPATSPRHYAGDDSEKVNEDDTVPGPSSADSSTDQRGLVISPQFQGSLQPSSPIQGALGSSTSSQDAQGLSLSTREVMGGTLCDQGPMGHSISSQASQKHPPCAERKIEHVSLPRRAFRSPSCSQGVTNHSNSPPKSFRQAPSDQGGLHQARLDKESSKCFSPKGMISDFSFSQNIMFPTLSPQGSLTPLTAAKDDWRATPSHEESQGCFPSPQNDPKQPISGEVSLSPASSDQGNFITSPLKHEDFKCSPPENGHGSSLTAQGGPSPITTPQVSLTPLMPTQAETSTPGIQELLSSSEGALESSTYLQEMLGSPKSIQGTLVPSQHTQRSLAPASTSLGVLSPSLSVKRTLELSTPREEGQRSILSHKGKFKPNPDMKMDNGYSQYSKKRRMDPLFEQDGFTVSLSNQEGFKYTLPTKKALLIHDWKQKSQRYAKRVQVSHARSTTIQGTKTIQPSLLPQESLGLSTCVGEALEIPTYTPGLPGHLQPTHYFLGSTICDKGTVGQDTSAEGVPDSSPSLEMALGCDTCTQEFVANSTSREGNSLDSACPQTPTGPLNPSQEAVEIFPSPRRYQQSVTTTQEALGPFPSAQRDVSLSTCPQVTPEHPTNTPKVLKSTLSSQGPLKPVLSSQLSLDPNISIQKALLSSSPEESIPKTSTFTQGAPVTSLAAHEDCRPTTYAQETLGDTTPTHVLETSPHSEAVVKKHTCTPDTVAPFPSEQEALGSTISEEGTLPSTQERFMHIPSQEGNIKNPPSTQVDPGHSISTKKRLRDDPLDEGDFGTSSSEEGGFILLPSSKKVCASSTTLKETSITTSIPQVSPTTSISVQKALKCSTSEQKTVEPCHSNQGPREHSISSQEAQGPSLSVPKGLCHLPSVPGLQGHSPSQSKAPENSTYTQGDLSISKSDLGALKSSLSANGSKGKAKCKQKHIEPLLSVQKDLMSPMSSKPPKDPYASYYYLAKKHFPAHPGSPVPSTSKQWYLETSPSCQGFLGHSPSASGALCCFQASQRAKEILSSAQGPQESFPLSLSYSGHLPNLPGDQEDSSLEQGILEHVPPSQGFLETSCSPGMSLQRPLLSLQRPLDLSIPTQGSNGTLPSTQKALGSLLSLSSKVGISQSAQGLQRFLPSTHEYLENSLSAFMPLEHLPVAPRTRGLSTLSQETPSPLLPVHGILELPQYDSVALPSMPSVQGLQGSLSSSEGSIAPVLSVQGSVGHSLSAQEPIEFSRSTKATPGHSLSVLDDMSPFKSSQGTLGPLSSVGVDGGTHSHNKGSPGQLKNISGIPGSMISDHDPVVISSPAQGTHRHLPSAQEDVGLSLSAQQAPKLSTLEQGSIQHVEAAKVALLNPSSSKGATRHFQCAQYALEHLPPSAIKHSSTQQGSQESLKSSQESLEILSSNSEHVKNSLSATGGLESSLSGPRVLGHMVDDKHPEQLSIYAQESLGNSLSTQEAQENLAPLIGNLKPCQSAKEGLKTLIPSQIVLESSPSISEDLGALSSALEHMGLSSLAKESLENSEYAESVVESSSSATGALRPTLFAQKSLENSLPGKGIRETLSSSQGALEIFSFTKGRVENVSFPERSVKPPTSLQEASSPSSLIQGPHQHPLSAQGPLGPSQTDSGIQEPLLPPEAGGNLPREPGSWKSFPLTPGSLDHLQSAEGSDDLSISAHGMFNRKLGHVSYVGKDGEISPFEKPTKSTSPLTPYLPFNTEVLESSSCGLGSLGSLLSAREDAKGTPSAPHAQEPSSSTSQALEHFVTTQGPLQIKTPDKQTLCPLPSTVEDVEHSTFSRGFPGGSQMLPNVLDHQSSRAECEEFSLSALGTKNSSLLDPEPLEHSSLQNANQGTSPCPQEVVGSLLSEQGSLGWSLSDHGSLGPLASTLGAGGPSRSEADTIQLSAPAPMTKAHLTSSLGPSASKYYNQMKVGFLPALHGDLEASQSDQRTLEMTKFAEGALENLSVAHRTTKLSTCSQEASKSSLSDQSHLLHSSHVKKALIPALSDQKTGESMLSPSEDTEHPPSLASAQMQEPSLSTLGTQDSLLTTQEPLELSISVCDSLCPFPSSQESENVELSTPSAECLEPSQHAQGEPGYFSAVGQGKEHSSTASPTTRKLFLPQGCAGHLSSAPSVQELFQSGPVDVATLLSSQGPQKPFKLAQGLLHPSASAQESQEPSESSQDFVGTHESSERIHEYFLPEVEPVEAFTSVSGTTVTSPSAPQPQELSSLLHVTSATSLTDQKVVGRIPPPQRPLEVLSLAQGTLEPLASARGNGRNSQLEKDTVEQSFSVQSILGSLPCTTGVLRSTPYAHKLPEILPSTQKGSLSPKGSLVLPISANGTLENLHSDHELTKHSNAFQEASRHSLLVQGPLQDSPSASETLRPSSNQGIKKSLLCSPGAVKPSSSAPDANKPLQTTLRNRPTRLSNQGHQENSMSLQGTLGTFSSRSASVEEHSAPSPLILGPPASFQSKLGHLFCTDTSPSFQGPTGPLSFPSGTTGHLQHGTRSHESSLSTSRDLAHLLSDQLYISTQGTLASSPYSQQARQQSASSQEMLGLSKFDKCTHSHLSSVPDDLGMSPFVPMITSTLPQIPMTPGLSSLTQASPVPSPSLQKDDEFCLSSQATLEGNTSGQETLKPPPTTQVPEKASLYTKPTLVKPTQAQRTEGHPASKSKTNQNTLKELGVSPPAQRPLVISLSTQGTLRPWTSAQGSLGSSLSAQGSLNLSTPTQGTIGTLAPSKRALKYPISSQEFPKFYSSSQHTVQTSASSPRTTGLFQSSQKPQGSFLSSLEHIEHSPAAPDAQETPLSNPWTLGPLLSSKVPKELSTATEETLPVLSSLSSIQRSSKHSVYPSKVLKQHQYSQNTLGHLSCVREGVETSQSATRTIEALPPPLVPRGHLTSIQGSAESFPSDKGKLEPLKPAQGPLKHVMSSQEMLHSAQFAEGTLQLSALSQAVPEPYTNSPSTQVTRETFPSVPGLLGLLSSAQATPLSSRSDETAAGTCPSSQASLKMAKSVQGTLESSASQGTGEFLLSSKGTMGNLTSVKQAVGPFPSMTEPLRSIQNTQTLLGSLKSGQSSLGVSQATEGPVDPSLVPQGSLDLSVSAQGTLATLLCNQGTRRHPASSQTPQKTSQSVENSLQHPASVPGFMTPSQSEKSNLGSLSSPPGTGISAPDSQEMFKLSVSSGYPEPLLYFGLPLELAVCAQGTLCPFSSPQGELDPLHCFSGNLETSQPAQMNLSHLSSVREPVGNSPSVPGPREPSPFNKVPRGLSSHVPGDPASLISDHLPLERNVSAQCSLSPSASSKDNPGSLLSSADIQGKVQNTRSYHGQLSHIRETLETSPSHVGSSVYQPCPQETLGLYSLGQGSQATYQCAQETVGSCLSTQGSMGLSTSAQRSLRHPPPAQGLSGTSSHTQHTCSQSTSAQRTAAYSSSTPVSQVYSQHAKKMGETLKSAPESPRISITAQGSVESLLSPWKSPGYSSSAPGACETSTPTRGHVVSDDRPLELSISAQANLSPFHSSQCLLEPSLSVEGTFGLSTPMEGTLGPSVSSLGPLGSWQSAHRVQQTDPSASDSSGSEPSSKGQMVISLSGQGTLGPISSSLEPLEISLSVQVSSRPSLSLQEAGGIFLYSQGRKNLEVSPCAHGNLVLSNSLRGDLRSSSSTPGTLGSSPPAKVDLGMSPSVSWTLRPPVSAQGVLGTSTSAREVNKPSLASKGKTETLPYAQDDLGLRNVSVGTEGNFQFSKAELKVLPSVQGGFKPALSTPGPVEKLLSASRTPKLFSSTLQDAGSFSLSSQNNSELCTSSQKHLESSPTPQTSLKHSPSSQESLGPTPSAPGSLEYSLQDQGWQKVSAPAKVTVGQTPHQKGYEGNSLSAQGSVRLSISGQESLGHCSFDQESSTSSHKVQDPSYNQGSAAQFPPVPGDTHSLSVQGILQNLSSSQVTLETSSSLQKDIEGSLDVHGAQQLQSHSLGYVGHFQCTPKSSETLSSPQMVLKFSESSSVTQETLPPLPGTLGHSISAQSDLFPSDSDQQIQKSSPLQKSVHFSPSSKGSLRPTPSVPGTSQSLVSAQLCPKLSISAQGFLGSLPPQQGCLGDSLSMKRALGTSISAQEVVEHSKSDQESPEMFTSSQEDLGPSLSQEALVYTSSTPQDCGLSQSSKDTLGTSLSTQGTRKTRSSVHGSIVTTPSAQSVLGIQTSLEQPLGTSQFASETTEPLPSSEEVYSTLKSISRSIKTLTSILETLKLSTSAKGASDSSIMDQVILRSPTVSHKALEFSLSDQPSVKSASSQMGPDRTSLTDKGLQEMSLGEKVTLQDSPLQQICSGNALGTQGALGLSISAQESLGHSSSAHGSPDTSLLSEAASGTCLDQGPLGHSLSLTDLGDLGQSEYSQGPLETSPSTHSTLEIPSSTHGILETSPPAQDSLGHLPPSVQILQQAPLMPETSEPLTSTKEACDIPDSSPGTSEPFPSTPGSLEISFSAQSTMDPSVSEKEILGPSVSLEESLGPSPPDQGSLRSTPSSSGTGSLYPLDQGCQELSSGVQGDSPSQQGYTGNSLHSQEAVELSILAWESLGHSPSAQGSPDTSLSSQEALGPSLNHGPLGQSSSDPAMLELPDSDQGTLETPPFTQSILEIPSSNNGVTETSTTSQDSLEHLPPSVQTLQPSLTPETSEPLPTAKDVCKTSESISGTLESFPSLLEDLRHLNSDQCTLGPLVYDQGNLEPSTPLHDTLGNAKSSQGVLEPIPSTQESVGPFFSTEYLGLSTCAHDDFIPIPSHGNHLRCSSYPNKGHRLSNSTKKRARHAPFPEGNISYSLSELEALRSFPSAKHRLTSSIYVRKDSSSTCTSPRSVTPPESSELYFRSSSPPRKYLRCSPSPQGGSRHSKSKKTKPRHASKESCRKSVTSEDEDLKFHHSSKKGGRDSVSNKVGARLKTEPKEILTTTSAKGGSHEEGLRCSPSSQGSPRHSRSTKIKLEQVPSNKADVHVSHSEHEGCKLRSLSKTESRHSSSKRDQKPKAISQECIEPSISKGGCRSSRSHEEGGRSPASPRGSHKHSRSIKTKSEQAPSNKADVHASHREHEGCKHLSLSQRGFRHASSAKRDKKPNATPQESIETSTSTEEDIGTTPSHEETLRHSTSPHGISSLTSTTSTRTRLRHSPYTQEVIKTSTEAQESFRSSPDGDSPSGSANSFSSPQSNDVRYPVSTKEYFKHTLSVQGGQKPSTGAREGSRAWIPVQWGLLYSTIPKGSATSFPVVQGNFRHTLPQLADLRSSLSYQGRDTAFQYEHGTPICNPSVLGGHRYSRSVPCSLRRIPLQKKSLSSYLSPQGGIRPSQCDQSGLRLSYGHSVQGSFRMFQSERESLKTTPSKTLSLRFAPCDQREVKTVPPNVEWVRTSTSAPGSPQRNPSAHGGFKPYKTVKLKF